ncbi:hypothetical protein LCGC14_1012350 [marine sediment metagenome]|uniref:Aldo/keto reductase n=1 Tax=marine sediment metagenome TaxID=412755 RepID=A0A0F9MZY9_9ZZZZ|nr:MAG: hypothetical protein Lokiarch_50270 [Candidatus Lokiarchaeum sp. GC14_75]
MKLKIDSKFGLNNGIEVPLLGLGTWILRYKDFFNLITLGLTLKPPEFQMI